MLNFENMLYCSLIIKQFSFLKLTLFQMKFEIVNSIAPLSSRILIITHSTQSTLLQTYTYSIRTFFTSNSPESCLYDVGIKTKESSEKFLSTLYLHSLK